MQTINYLLAATAKIPEATGTTIDYLPVVIHVLFALAFVAGLVWLSHYLGPSRSTNEKLDIYAGGIASHGDARQPMNVKYFLVAILFVLFDVEIIFFYPYAVNFRELGWPGFITVLIFVSLFIVGLLYIFRKGALVWED